MTEKAFKVLCRPTEFSMIMLSILGWVLGAATVALTLYDVFQGVVVPRWTGRKWRLAPHLVAWLWPRWKLIAWRMRGQRAQTQRNDWLASFAPTMLVVLLASWVGLLILGYGLMLFALRGQIHNEHSFGDALYFAGVSLLTIGFGDIFPLSTFARIVVLSAGASGMVVTALVISLSFTLYGGFSRREVLVLTLDARAGSPPSGVSLLETHAQFDLLDELPRMFNSWELWAAEMLDSHLAYPLLPYFRSSHAGCSWVGALGAILDAATLLMTTVCAGDSCGQKPIGAAHLMYHMGCHTVDDLSVNLFAHHADFAARKRPGTPDAGVERGEFAAARRRLEKAGFALRPEDESWELFAHHRAVYASQLNALARHFATPPSQWIGDRSSLSFASHHDAHPKAAETMEELPVA